MLALRWKPSSLLVLLQLNRARAPALETELEEESDGGK
jgi:hypothetical protein